ncbi:uncharacterized protein PHACADRAFT_188921 [Phanerochaete carnosa HHB-10118-sp]|uniref:CxC1-like cysteine cluster associated with KDZ transposases domain-containing protein n=1 Tax=Phanerochaete carnosa (strain HHB-10118-sp) TaxID=650164 RepID=K5WGP2_PHACS|nr:uncharacterized protein PHACADRAFT_188921 [Phanerochaete carnosa HHB-10118-sp]EKM49342.1 hypothetical protein PHACADRAFT_188921 [Phanerochaete carnosa HHB-10118-sp]
MTSGAGSEVELCEEILQKLNFKPALCRRRHDPRTRHDRTHLRNTAWMEQMDLLVDAYLTWRDRGNPIKLAGASDDCNIEVRVVNFFDTFTRRFPVRGDGAHPNVLLAKHGYLGTAPLNPTIATGFRLLKAYRQLHRVCPKLSVYAQVKALCHLHGFPFWRALVDEFSQVYDVYLEILHQVNKRVNTALRRDEPDWRLKNICPSCMYLLENEPEMALSMLCTMDGNSSLKLVDSAFQSGTTRIDERTRRADFWISPEDVDRFKNEHKSAKGPPVDPDVEELQENQLTLELNADCVQRWRSAAPDERKKMFALFRVSGIFACYCRHGHLLLACDMIRSGELRKYPLAVIDWLLSVHGKQIGLGYDVGCDLHTTVMSSSLGERARKQELRLVVPAFHGHAHNRLCQLSWHPMYVNGTGKEDFEGSERAFSDSNQLASGTRLATGFHRAQAIETHVAHRSKDKHSLKILHEDGHALEVLLKELRVSSADFEGYIDQEREYLKGLKAEPRQLSLHLEYFEVLQTLENARAQAAQASAAYDSLEYNIQHGNLRGGAITAIKNHHRHAWTRLERAETDVELLEKESDVDKRWTPEDQCYKDAVKEQVLRKYRLALDNLKRIVIQRLLELSKLGMSGLGYKLREKIGKALRTRAEAVRKALEEYNRQAVRLDPPRPKPPWTELISMVSLGGCTIRRASIQEINRCHLEIRHLLTFMYDEHVDYCRAISTNLFVNPLLARELSNRWVEYDHVNHAIIGHLRQIAALHGFTGSLESGVHLGRDLTLLHDVSAPAWAVILSMAEGVSVTISEDTNDAHAENTVEDGDNIPGRDPLAVQNVLDMSEDVGTQGAFDGVDPVDNEQVEELFEFIDQVN